MIYSEFFDKWKKNIHRLVKSKQGLVIMAAICFMEPVFLPMFPELVIAPVMLARKKEWVKVLCVALLGTTCGSILTYVIAGLIGKILLVYAGGNLMYLYETGLEYLHTYGFFLPFIGSLTPFPLKIITWTCGLTKFHFFIYICGIFFGRLLRYSLIMILQKTHSHKNKIKSHYLSRGKSVHEMNKPYI
jgi:membrane protein YqaA with SNARE-associated domain